MAKITDKVSIQLYGCPALEKQIIDVLKSSGVAVTQTADKDYTTKKGEEGHYMALKLTYEDS